MKKYLALLLALVCLFSLCACGASEEPAVEESAAEAPAAEEAPVEEAAAEEPAVDDGWSGTDYVLTWNEVNGDTYGATVAAKAFAEKIEEISNGHIKIELYTNGTLGSEAESMQAIQMGTLDIFRGNASSLPNYGAELIGATGLPYVFKNMAEFEAVAESSLGDELLQSVEDADCGYIALGWLVEGPRSMFITQACYEKLGSPTEFTMDMLAGLKVRVPETDLMINTMKALGASATPIAYSELYTSLENGTVDAAENGVTSYMDNSFNEPAPYFITDAHTFGCGVILVSAESWGKLNETEQGWMREAALYARGVCYEYNQSQEQACFDSFAEKGITKLEVADIENWQAACAPVYATQSEEAQAIVARIQSGDY